MQCMSYMCTCACQNMWSCTSNIIYVHLLFIHLILNAMGCWAIYLAYFVVILLIYYYNILECLVYSSLSFIIFLMRRCSLLCYLMSLKSFRWRPSISVFTTHPRTFRKKWLITHLTYSLKFPEKFVQIWSILNIIYYTFLCNAFIA